MTVAFWSVIGIVAVGLILMVIGAAELERRNQRWDYYNHPPDSEVKFDDEDSGE